MIPFSVLDLSPIARGSNATIAFANSRDLAQHAERWGYQRYWLAEHHNMTGIASAATSLVISHVAAGTQTIRVGAGGIMLPNHAPLVIAEQFGTLEALYPGRIDLGLGRAPGSDQQTARALRRNLNGSPDNFVDDVQELRAYFQPMQPGQAVRAVPGAGLNVPVWLLGSSLFSAQLAAKLGLPFAFASHFAPDYLLPALKLYRQHFQPSAVLEKPYAMVGAGVFAAQSDAEAKRLFSSAQMQFLNLLRGTPGELSPPVDDIAHLWSPQERNHIERTLACSIVGAPATIKQGLHELLAETQADELIVTAQIYDHAARLHSYELLAEVRNGL
ncbi:MAG: flavin dependent oxidoreductase [Verrucomicrobiaceae bacterium]|nr:flavin dependent oxidoreductase [Verrucomicrobiaceae bacterium]